MLWVLSLFVTWTGGDTLSRPVRRRGGRAAGEGGEPAGAPEESRNVPAALRNFQCSNEKHAEYLFSNNSRKTTHILEVMNIYMSEIFYIWLVQSSLK